MWMESGSWWLWAGGVLALITSGVALTAPHAKSSTPLVVPAEERTVEDVQIVKPGVVPSHTVQIDDMVVTCGNQWKGTERLGFLVEDKDKALWRDVDNNVTRFERGLCDSITDDGRHGFVITSYKYDKGGEGAYATFTHYDGQGKKLSQSHIKPAEEYHPGVANIEVMLRLDKGYIGFGETEDIREGPGKEKRLAWVMRLDDDGKVVKETATPYDGNHMSGVSYDLLKTSWGLVGAFRDGESTVLRSYNDDLEEVAVKKLSGSYIMVHEPEKSDHITLVLDGIKEYTLETYDQRFHRTADPIKVDNNNSILLSASRSKDHNTIFGFGVSYRDMEVSTRHGVSNSVTIDTASRSVNVKQSRSIDDEQPETDVIGIARSGAQIRTRASSHWSAGKTENGSLISESDVYTAKMGM